MQLRLLFALEITERREQSAPEPPVRPVVNTTGEAVQLRPLAKCGEVVTLATYRKRRSAGR